MSENIEPTAEGRLRYPGYVDEAADPPVHYAAGYNHAFTPPIPCTCTPTCQARCAGECGCQACLLVFSEYANMCGWYGPKDNPQGPPLEQQLAQYRRALGPQKRT